MMRILRIHVHIVCFFFLLDILLCNGSEYESTQKLRSVYSWKSLDFHYPNEEARQEAINKREFIPGQPVPIDIDVSQTRGSRVFMTIPRFQEGVPVTLGYIKKKGDGKPLIAPYPNWNMNKLGDCDHITSVYRIKVDECGRLWVLDTGTLISNRICPSQLLVFDLNTDQLITRYKFPEEQLRNSSLLITPVVDIRGLRNSCQETFVYIADVTGFQLIVYDHQNKRSWNIQNNLFYPYPSYGTFTIAGESFDLMDGIFGLALGPVLNGDRILYFHSLASVVEGRIRTSIIRDINRFKNDPTAAAREFKIFKGSRSSQAASQGMDKNGVLFYGLTSDTAIGCWNSHDYPEFGGNNLQVLVVDEERLQFASGLKIISSLSGRDELWVMTIPYQKLMSGSLNPSETNFRIEAGYIDELVRGSKCDVTSHRII